MYLMRAESQLFLYCSLLVAAYGKAFIAACVWLTQLFNTKTQWLLLVTLEEGA